MLQINTRECGHGEMRNEQLDVTQSFLRLFLIYQNPGGWTQKGHLINDK